MSNETREDRRARRAREEETTRAVSKDAPKGERVVAVFALVDKPASVSPEGYPISGGLCAVEVAPDAVDVSNPLYKSPPSFAWECAVHIQRRLEMKLQAGKR